MLQKNFVIYTLDKIYGKKLLEMAISQKKKGLHFYLFHELEGLLKFQTEQDVYYLVMGSEIPIETRAGLKGMRKFLLREEAIEEDILEETLDEESLRGETVAGESLKEDSLKGKEYGYSTGNLNSEIFICKYQKGEDILKEIYLERALPIEGMFRGGNAESKEGMFLGDRAESREGVFLSERADSIDGIYIRERVNPKDNLEEYHLREGLGGSENLNEGESEKRLVKEALTRELLTRRNQVKEGRKKEIKKQKKRKKEGGVGEIDKEDRQGKVIGIYSPVHRIGKTKFAICLGREMAEQESVLYLNLEPFAKGSYFEEKEEGDLSNLLYFGSQENQNLGLCISVMAGQLGKLDYIKPMPYMEDLYRVEVRQWKELLNKILEHSIYQTIILDLSDGMKDLFEILDFCDTVYTLYIEEPIALEKLKQYTDNLIKTGYDSVLEHTVQKRVELK